MMFTYKSCLNNLILSHWNNVPNVIITYEMSLECILLRGISTVLFRMRDIFNIFGSTDIVCNDLYMLHYLSP